MRDNLADLRRDEPGIQPFSVRSGPQRGVGAARLRFEIERNVGERQQPPQLGLCGRIALFDDRLAQRLESLASLYVVAITVGESGRSKR